MKKVLTLIVVMVLILSMLSITAYAWGDDDEETYGFMIRIRGAATHVALENAICKIYLDGSDEPLEFRDYYSSYSYKEYGSGVTELASNSSGLITVEGLPEGDYIIVQEPYDGYVHASNKEISLPDDDGDRINIYNTPTIFRLSVTDALTDVAMADVVLVIKNSSDEVVETVTTDESGTAKVYALSYGSYTITHQSIAGYIDHSDVPFDINGTFENVDVTIQPDPTYVKMSVSDAVTSEAISDVELSIKNSSDEVVKTVTTDSDGEAQAYTLPVGSYTLTQQSVSGYFDSDDVSFDVASTNGTSNPVVLDIQNDPINVEESGQGTVEATVSVSSTIESTTISVTHPTSVSYTIDPNLGYEDSAFIAPDITITNNSKVAVNVTVKSLTATTGGFTDVEPDAYTWSDLNVAESKSYIALGVLISDGTGWNAGYATDTRYAVEISDSLFGSLNAGSTGNLTMTAKYGLAINQSFTSVHNLVLMFNLA